MFEDRTTLEFPRDGVVGLGFRFDPELLCCLAAGPGGAPLHVLIDTGTDPSAIDLRLAQRLALHTRGSGLGRGAASDSVEFTEAVLPWLRLGDLTIRNLYAPALDLSSLPFRIDVVLGYNVLRQISLRIDYRRRQLTIAHPDVTPPDVSRSGQALPLAFYEHFPAIRDVEVDGRRIPLATIDTGSNGALMVAPDLAATLGMEHDEAGVTQTHGVGFGGGGTMRRRRYRQMRLGSFALNEVDIDAVGGGAGDLNRTGRANIGNRLLARFARVTLDYERSTVVLEPET